MTIYQKMVVKVFVFVIFVEDKERSGQPKKYEIGD